MTPMKAFVFILALVVAALPARAADIPVEPRPSDPRLVTAVPNGVLVLPSENLSGAPEAEQELARLLSQRMMTAGWKLVSTEGLEERLELDRVRYLDSLTPELARRLSNESGAAAILTTTIYIYGDGKDPAVGVCAKLVGADGALLWGNAAALTAAETAGIFGFGRRSDRFGVADLAVASLMRGFPKPGVAVGAVRGEHGPILASSKREFIAPDLATPDPKRVFVLPFRNFTYDGGVARIVADMLTLRLAAAKGMSVVSPAELRAAALRANIATFREISPESLKRLAAALGTPYCMSGVIYSFVDPRVDRGSDPEIDLEISLSDVRDERTLWIAQSEKAGLDYAGLLLRGAEKNTVALTDRVISDMLTGVVWSDPRVDPDVVARRTQKRLLAKRAQLVRGTPTGDQE